jgi:hypothetical protein
MADCEIFELGDVVLQSGISLRRAKIAYKTYGELAPSRNNVIVMPTYYSGQHVDNEAMIGPGSDAGSRHRHAVRDGPLFSGARQSARGRMHAECGAAPDPFDLGTRGRPGHEPSRQRNSWTPP